jgi:glucosamine--fructose-6-phosphate aminotransferase (isomerizing)
LCGIVGYIGEKEAAPILINGLKKLEYRGYDSAGIAVYGDKNIEFIKAKGRLKILEDKIKNEFSSKGTMGIGHTRWATHGEPSDINSHPHMNGLNTIALVHNGIIENYLKLKEMLIKKGYVFLSETDTEVLAHLIDYYYDGDIVSTMIEVIHILEGSYALGVIFSDQPDKIVAVRKDSPLIIGLGNNENFIASDVPAVLEHTRDVYFLEDKEIVIVKKDSVKIYNLYKEEVKREIYTVEWDVAAAEKGGYEHFMMKEIFEQPKAIKDTINPRIKNGEIILDNIELTKEDVKNIDKIYIIACGTASYAGMVGKYLTERFARIPTEVVIASEFRYIDPIVSENTLIIIISQSGETADTLAALREAKKKGAKVFSVVNVVGSSISRESDNVLYTWAGPEIAVASTKAYSTQLTAMYLVSLYLAEKNDTLEKNELREILKELNSIPDKVENILEKKEELQHFASLFFNERHAFYIGRGIDYALSMEGSLKLKEISYIHSEAYAAGELKHGTIALIEEGTLVIALATQDKLFDKMLSNIKEVKARGAVVLGIAMEGNTEIEKEADYVFYIPKTNELLASILTVIPLQLFAYYVAVTKGCDVDKPRNLAKSVTVE